MKVSRPTLLPGRARRPTIVANISSEKIHGEPMNALSSRYCSTRTASVSRNSISSALSIIRCRATLRIMYILAAVRVACR
ncbi:CaiF/GrlA family transcriptional regulator [Stenotrophomonas sp. 2619]|uniref:CaiF/GrlA family transcriptional regulator n=1 Tax=Stenotrophomonas sp. 2619 TaxID=3156316 RepID=UPI003391E15F